jgi:FixJ family two-component response regulator
VSAAILDTLTASEAARPFAAAHEARLLARPPRLTEGEVEVLRRLGPDLTAREWAALLGVDANEVDRALAWIRREEREGRAT